MIQFLVPVAVSLVWHALCNGATQSEARWELAGTSTDGCTYELDAVERMGVYANSDDAAVRIERAVSRQWQRSVAWDVKAAVEKAAKANIGVAASELTASLELHRRTETTEQYTSSQRIAVDIKAGSRVEILVHWYRQIQAGRLSLTKPADSSNARPTELAVPYREVTGLMAEVHVNPVPAL